jgi:endonuclease III
MSRRATGTGMKPGDEQLCRNAITELTSTKNMKVNYIFLEPHNLGDTPGYSEVVQKAMDLSTLSKNLEAGEYSNRNQFFDDADLIFHNALKYHRELEESDWILKLAAEMLKICENQRPDAKQTNKRKSSSTKTQEPKGPKKGPKKATESKKKTKIATESKKKTKIATESKKKTKIATESKKKTKIETGKKKDQNDKATTPTITKKNNAGTRPPLPLDDNLDTWKKFGDDGGYKLSRPKWLRLRSWVSEQHENPGVIADRVTFHRLIVGLKAKLSVKSPRDAWADVLPNFIDANFFFATLVLMICTPQVPDKKIIDVFGKLFREYTVTPQWVIELGEEELANKLTPLGRQIQSANFITKAAKYLLHSDPPRDYRDLQALEGVGSKIALVTMQEALGSTQGIPCDIHMCRMFTILGWIPTLNELGSLPSSVSCRDMLENKKNKKGNEEKEKFDYELARAAMEGWFPQGFWNELNQTWAGLGQLLNDEGSRSLVCKLVDEETVSFDSPWREGDRTDFQKLLGRYLRTR